MNNLHIHAAAILFTAFALSCAYEIYRAVAKRGTSEYDSPRIFFSVAVPFYVVSFGVTALLLTDFSWANELALGYTTVLILVAIFFYSPKIALERKPELIDWVENLLYLGLLFSAATLLVYAVWN